MPHGAPKRVNCVRTGASSGFNLEAAVKQELGVQSAKLNDTVRERVVQSVKELRGRAVVGEVAARAGVKLSEADDALKALAYDSSAVLEVSSEGDVVYVFPSGFQDAIRNKSLLLRARPLLTSIQSGLWWGVRIAFGSALFASIAIALIAITVLLSQRGSDDRDRRGGGGFGFGFGRMFMPDLWMMASPSYSRRRDAADPDEEMSFPEAIFSFVFGDGDPNAGYEEARWRALGRFISANDGVVTAEEMAPFLDPPEGGVSTSGASGLEADDSYVLPALLRFGGEPFVDDAGHLLYSFPSLQKSTGRVREVAGRRGLELAAREARAALPLVQEEDEWALSAATAGQVAGAAALGIANVGLVWFLGDLLSNPQMAMYAVREGLGWVVQLLPLLQVYAASFFAIPALRAAWNTRTNGAIALRNAAREAAAAALARPPPLLAAKRAAARLLGQRKVLGKDDIVFSTEKDGSAAEAEAREFDRRLAGGK